MNGTPYGPPRLLVGADPKGTSGTFPVGIFGGWWRSREPGARSGSTQAPRHQPCQCLGASITSLSLNFLTSKVGTMIPPEQACRGDWKRGYVCVRT